MIVSCTFRDIHGYHQIDNVSTKRPATDEPFMKTRVQSVSDETIRLEINFNRYPLTKDRLQRDAVSKARRRIVRDGTVVILDARI
jgi:adenosine deaminase